MKQMFTILSLASLCCSAAQAYKVTVQNETNYTLRVKTNYMGESRIACRPDIFTLKPQERKEINSGGCLLIGIKAAGFTAGPERLAELKNDNHNDWYKIADLFVEPGWVDAGESLGSEDFVIIQTESQAVRGRLSKGLINIYTVRGNWDYINRVAKELREQYEKEQRLKTRDARLDAIYNPKPQTAPAAPALAPGATFAPKAAVKLPTAEDLQRAERNLEATSTPERKLNEFDRVYNEYLIAPSQELLDLYKAKKIDFTTFRSGFENLQSIYIRLNNILDNMKKDPILRNFSEKIENLRNSIKRFQEIFKGMNLNSDITLFAGAQTAAPGGL